MTTKGKQSKYVALTGLDYKDSDGRQVRVEEGDEVKNMPEKVVAREVSDGKVGVK